MSKQNQLKDIKVGIVRGIMKVYIWYPRPRARQLGHAALTLDDGTYITCWQSKIIVDFGSLEEDIWLEGQVPDRICRILGRNEEELKSLLEVFIEFFRNVMDAFKENEFMGILYGAALLSSLMCSAAPHKLR